MASPPLPPGIALPAFSRLSTRVVRLLGMNPGPFTLGGSNTYLLGTGYRRLLIDTGEGHPDHMSNIERALSGELEGASSSAAAAAVLDTVLLTHHHRDHTGGIAALASRFPTARFFKAPSAVEDEHLMATLRHAGFAGELLPITPHQVFAVEGATVVAVPAPGHTDDHVVLHLREEDALFTGDVILGVGSSVFAHYKEYMNTLQVLKQMAPSGPIYPGHAEMCSDAVAKIDEYIAHRHAREVQLVEALSNAAVAASNEGGGGDLSIEEIVLRVYRDTPTHLHTAAGGNVLQYLRKLLAEGRVRRVVADDQSAHEQQIAAFLAQNEYEVSGEGKALNVDKMQLLLQSRWALVPAQVQPKL